MKATLVCLGLFLVTVGCSQDTSAPTQTPELTEEHGCGIGFYLGNRDQTAGLFITFNDFEAAQSGDVPESSLEDDVWRAELQFGSDPFATWCDDVLEPGEPIPEIDETWTVTGTIEITELPPAGDCGPAAARLMSLEAQGEDGETLTLGDFEVANGFWGCFAG
ncbi:MAG TPA: hypothetical protein VMP13_06415 [Acidimicrobiia bacterium]|nr:hypothetical protein [Acidimicrobiia bacterium]